MLRTIEVHSRDQFSLYFRRDSNWMDSDKHTALYHRFVETY